MSAAELTRFDELVSRYIDDALTDDDAAELAALLAEPPLAARFLETTRLNSEIAGLLAAPVPDAAMVELVQTDIRRTLAAAQPSSAVRLRIAERTQPHAVRQPTLSQPRPRPRQSKAHVRTLAWAAVFLALAGLAWIYFSDAWPPARKMEVAAVNGEVYFSDASGQARLTAQQPLSKAGKLKTVGAGSTATLVLSDGTRVDVGGNSLLTTEAVKGNARFFLEDGSLKSQIAKQPKKRSVTFATPEAEAMVKGTALSLVTWRHHTRLEITEGVVLLKRRQDGTEVIVRAGYHVLVEPDAKLIVGPNETGAQHR